MIVNAAIFTCSICGEASVNICSYCTKDACSNHRCDRCKRCSDCCECEFPLSAEEPAPEAMTHDAMTQDATTHEAMIQEPAAESVPEVLESETPAPKAEPFATSFLTAEESSVFAEETVAREPRIFGESSVFAPEDESDVPEATDSGDEVDPSHSDDPYGRRD